MALDLTPSPRPHGAQRMFSATTLVVEAFVVFFAVLAAHQLVPGDRVTTWIWGIVTVLALLACSGMLKRGAWPYWLGMALQIPAILLGFQVTAMWVVGLAFAALFIYGAFKGNQLDREKDAVDARVYAAQGEDPQNQA